MSTTQSKQYLPRLVKFLIFVLATILVFVSQDPNLNDQTTLTKILHNYFFRGFIHPDFSIFQFLIFLLCIYLVLVGNISFRNSSFVEKSIVLATFINIVFLMLNPNNDTENPLLGMPLLSDPSLFISLFLMISIFFNRNKVLVVNILMKLIVYIIWISASRAILLFLMYLYGLGNAPFFGIVSTLMEEDTLIFFVLISSIFLALYFTKQNKKYIMVWTFFLLIQMLSFRRSGTLSFILVNGSIFIIHFLYGFDARKKTIVFFTLFLILLGLNTAVGSYDVIPAKYQLYISRYVGAFIDLPSNINYEEETRNEHILQSNESFFYAIDNLPFWGFGYGNSEYRGRFNYKGNTGIHNAYYNLWEQFGLFYLFYILLFVLIFISESIKTYRYRKKYPYDYFLVRVSVIVFILIFWINSWVLTIHNLIGFKMVVIRIFLLAFLIYVPPSVLNETRFPKKLNRN